MNALFKKLLAAIKAAFDSVVRTYSSMIVGAVLGWLAVVFGPVPVPDEVQELVAIIIALAFQLLWYLILRVYELLTGKASKLLGLGLVKSEPQYDLVPAQTLPNGTQMFATRKEYHEYLRGLDDDADEQFRIARNE